MYNKPVGLYIGCGTDFRIMSRLLNDIHECIYIDSQPLTRYGDLYHNYRVGDDISNNYMIAFRENANNAGFTQISIDGIYPHVYRNYNTSQQIYHYFNMCFPIYTMKTNYAGNIDEIRKLIQKLTSVTHLIVQGYSPHYSIFKYLSNQVCFVGDHDTLYTEKLDDLLQYEYDKITIVLQKNLYNIRNRINKYIYFDKNMNRHELANYDEFIYKTQIE